MSQKPDEQEKELIRKIQRGEATVDFETGIVRSLESESDYNSHFLGKLRRKLIPNRRIYERISREEEAMGTKTTGIEQKLEQGIELTITPENFLQKRKPSRLYFLRANALKIKPVEKLVHFGV